MSAASLPSSDQIVESLKVFIERAVALAGSTDPLKPGHRQKFHWPPHAISRDFHVLPEAWSSHTCFEAHGETFDVEVAETEHGCFGRSRELWSEARGEDRTSMLKNLAQACEPLFRRQLAINRCLQQDGRFKGHLRDLTPEQLVEMLYCEDRDVAHHAGVEIETHASLRIFTPALIAVLRDERHPNRRVAQWCVLDLFEDLPSYCEDADQEREAVEAMADLIFNAPDDYARTTFKAGVVLGGHLPHEFGGPVLIRCLNSPSRFGRRSAIHGLFHVVEWQPKMRDQVFAALQVHAERETDPQLKEFATLMAADIEAAEYDHHPEPMFEGE
jgi:hypothetical protein